MINFLADNLVGILVFDSFEFGALTAGTRKRI